MPDVMQLNAIKGLLIYLVVINLVGYAMMWYDKRCAQNGQWRVKEKTLLIVSLMGGSIGSLAGMYRFRHKTKHVSFKYGIPFIIVMQIAIVTSIKLKLYIHLLELVKSAFNAN